MSGAFQRAVSGVSAFFRSGGADQYEAVHGDEPSTEETENEQSYGSLPHHPRYLANAPRRRVAPLILAAVAILLVVAIVL